MSLAPWIEATLCIIPDVPSKSRRRIKGGPSDPVPTTTSESPPTSPAILSSAVAAAAADPTHEPSEGALPMPAEGDDAAARTAANPRERSLPLALLKPTSTA